MILLFNINSVSGISKLIIFTMDDWVLTLLETNERVQRYVPNWFSVVENDQNVGSTTQGHGQHRNQVEFILYFYPHCFYSQKVCQVITF